MNKKRFFIYKKQAKSHISCKKGRDFPQFPFLTATLLVSFRFSTLTEFFIAKLDTNKEHKRDFKVQTSFRIKNTRFADYIEDLKKTYLKNIR